MEVPKVRYRLARPLPQRAASHVRVYRFLIVTLVGGILVWGGATSAVALLDGGHWWGLSATPTGDERASWRITWVDRGLARDNQVQVGTLVLSVDEAPPPNETAINQATTLRLLAPGQSKPRVLGWSPSRLDDFLSLSWIIIGAVSLLLGILIFLHAAERALALRFLGLWVGVGLAEVLEPATVFGNLMAEHVADLVTAGLAVGLLVDFLWRLLMPQRVRRGFLPDLFLLPGLLIDGVYLVAIQTHQPAALEFALRGYNAVLALGVVAALSLILGVSLRRKATVIRERGRTLLLGMVVGLLPLLVLTALPVVVTGTPLVLGQISSLSLIALPLAFSYAILRRDLLRLDALIRNSVVFFLTSLGLFLVLALLAAPLTLLFSFPALILAGLAGALLAPMVLTGARGMTEVWLFPQVRRYRRFAAVGDAQAHTGLDTVELAGQLVGELHLAFPVRRVALYLPEKHSSRFMLITVPKAPVPLDNTQPRISRPLTGESHDKDSTFLFPSTLLLDESLRRQFDRKESPELVEPVVVTPSHPQPTDQDTERERGRLEDGWRLMMPLRVRGRLVAVLALSKRDDGQEFSDTDWRLLRYLSSRRALALDYSVLYTDLHRAYERRQELDRMKDQFIVTAHHELRTPLTGVKGYLDLLRELGPEGIVAQPEQAKLFLERACHAADELNDQVDSLLIAAESDLQQTKLASEPVELVRIGQVVIQNLHALAERGHHRVHNTIPPNLWVKADPKAVTRVLLNLLSNALKYSPEGRPVLFDARATMVKGAPGLSEGSTPASAMAEVIVRDWGRGIPPSEQYKLFERFTRLERDLNSDKRGSGLGLSISKELVQAMGGGIWIESTGVSGSGSLIHFTLPLVEPPSPARDSSSAPDPTASSLHSDLPGEKAGE